MFFWYIATAIATVRWVFKDPRFDYRLLIVGSVLPLLDGLFGGARALHSMTVAIALLVVVMLVTAGRKPIRRTLLGLPIGMLMYLVYAAAWTDNDTFWWPFTGIDFVGTELPVVAFGWWALAFEAFGIGLLVWLYRVTDMHDPEHRRWFLRTGQLVGDLN